MKKNLLIVVLVTKFAPCALADVEVTMSKLRSIGILPQDKAELRPEDRLDIKRRNPFAERKKVAQNKPVEQVETEESRLRAFFDKQKVTGIMTIGGKNIVSLGRLSLEEGQIIRPIIPNQTQILRVMKVTDSELEIGWVEDASLGLEPAVPRKIQKRINLKPEVKALIAGAEEADEKLEMYALDDKGKVIVPQKGVLPNPSEILESIPPASDTNPASVLSEHERSALSDAEKIATPDSPAISGAAESLPVSEPTVVPPENPEDAVQPDPDLADPAAGVQPAGSPGRQ